MKKTLHHSLAVLVPLKYELIKKTVINGRNLFLNKFKSDFNVKNVNGIDTEKDYSPF